MRPPRRLPSIVVQIALALTLASGVGSCARSQLALTAHEATKLIEDHLTPEEERIQSVCELVTATTPAALGPHRG